MSQLSEEDRARGVVSASTGNHGQSIAYAAQLFGVRSIIVVPKGANPGKVRSMRALGAEVREHGRDFDEAREYVESFCEREGFRYVHSGNEPHLIAGVATYALEIFEDEPDIDVLICPLGGGSGVAGCCLVAQAVNPNVEVVATQAEAAPAGYLSWRRGELVEAEMNTFAEGVATRTAFELPQAIIRRHLSDFVLVSDDEMMAAIRLYLETTRNLTEGAGAAPLAAAQKISQRLAGRKVALVVSGGNLSLTHLRSIVKG